MKYYHSTAISYTFVPYIFSSAGIFFAKIFGGSLLIQFYMGRLFNLIAYSLFCYFALKRCKYFQKIIFAVALLPLVLFQAGTFSADVMTNAFSILSISLILNATFSKDKVKVKDLMLILTSCSIATISKTAYFPIFLLIMLIPKEKYENKKIRILTIVSSIILSLGLFLACTLYASHMGLIQWSVPGVDAKEQLLHIISHPFNYLMVIANTLNTSLIGYMRQGTISMAYNGELGDIALLIVIFMLFFVGLVNNDKTLNIGKKVILLIAIICCVGATMSSLYLTFTPVNAQTIAGFQGRYFIPVLMPVILLLNNRF
jgi:uncharacterized membrane protein